MNRTGDATNQRRGAAQAMRWVRWYSYHGYSGLRIRFRISPDIMAEQPNGLALFVVVHWLTQCSQFIVYLK